MSPFVVACLKSKQCHKDKIFSVKTAGQLDLVKKQSEKDFGEGHLCII